MFFAVDHRIPNLGGFPKTQVPVFTSPTMVIAAQSNRLPVSDAARFDQLRGLADVIPLALLISLRLKTKWLQLFPSTCVVAYEAGFQTRQSGSPTNRQGEKVRGSARANGPEPIPPESQAGHKAAGSCQGTVESQWAVAGSTGLLVRLNQVRGVASANELRPHAP